MSRKIFIVGAGGMVGSVCAYNLLLKELVENIVLIDIDPIKLNGQYLDLFHSTVVTKNTKVRIGNYSEIEDDDIVVITAGVAQKPGESRLSLCDSNECIIEDIVSKIMANGKNIFILMVTNPVDVLTYIAFKKSGLSKERVFGSGTTTDTIRLEAHLSEKLNVDQNNIEGYVLGEHGDSCFTSFSQTKVNGSPLQTLLNNYQISENSFL